MSSGGQLLVGRSTQSVYSFSMFPAGKHLLSAQNMIVPFLSSSLSLSLTAQNTANGQVEVLPSAHGTHCDVAAGSLTSIPDCDMNGPAWVNCVVVHAIHSLI